MLQTFGGFFIAIAFPSLITSSRLRDNPQSEDGKQPVDQENFKSKLVTVHPFFGVGAQYVTENGSQDTHQGNQTIPDLSGCEKPKGVKTEQWPVGIASHLEKGRNDGVIVDPPKYLDGQEKKN